MTMKQATSGQSYTDDPSVASGASGVYLVDQGTYYSLVLGGAPDALLLNQGNGAFEVVAGATNPSLYPELLLIQFGTAIILTVE